MSKRTTNILGIVIAVIAGTYFNIMMCNNCSSEIDDISSVENSEVIDNSNTVVEKKHKKNPN